MEQVQEIQFVDLKTNAPLVTIKGDNAQVLLEQSSLIQSLLESANQPNRRVLIVPLPDFVTDRRVLFTKILEGIPVGKDTYGEVEYYPVGIEEEKDIQAEINRQLEGRNNIVSRQNLLHREREQVIFDTMRFLLIPDDLIYKMLIFDVEQPTRNNVSIEDSIDAALELHKKYLFLRGLGRYLSDEDNDTLQNYFETIHRQYEKRTEEIKREIKKEATWRMAKRRTRYNSDNSNNDNDTDDYLHDKLDEIHTDYRDTTSPESYAPEAEEYTHDMTPIEYERFLREQYYKGAKGALPQGNFHLNSLFNENRRANRNRVNRPKVIYMNNNNNSTRKNKKNKNKNKNKHTKNNKRERRGGVKARA